MYRTCVGVVGKVETHTTIRPVYSNSIMKCQAHQKNGISEKKYKYYTPFVSKMHWRLSRWNFPRNFELNDWFIFQNYIKHILMALKITHLKCERNGNMFSDETEQEGISVKYQLPACRQMSGIHDEHVWTWPVGPFMVRSKWTSLNRSCGGRGLWWGWSRMWTVTNQWHQRKWSHGESVNVNRQNDKQTDTIESTTFRQIRWHAVKMNPTCLLWGREGAGRSW